jgi:hypothetical protein
MSVRVAVVTVATAIRGAWCHVAVSCCVGDRAGIDLEFEDSVSSPAVR